MKNVDKGVTDESYIPLGYWSFHGKSVDEAWYLLEWIVWDSFEFEKASHVSIYSLSDPRVFYAKSYYALFGAICVILLNMKLIHVCIMHAMLNLTLHHPWIILMLSLPYLIHRPFSLVHEARGEGAFWG